MKRFFACAIVSLLALSGVANAQEAQEAPDTTAKIDALQQQVNALKSQIDQLRATKANAPPAPASSPGAAAIAPADQPTAVVLKKGSSTTLQIGHESVTFYGNLDLSYDLTTKGLAKYYYESMDSPIGNVGYLPAISTNLSYIGVRGEHRFNKNIGAVYQLETQLDISATSGTVNTNSNNDSVVKGALTSRNSFIGINTRLGALKAGKTDAPYKTSTARMNPFNGEIGDYAVIMGNTGGDNRVEFGTRLDHSIWYESPIFGGGFALSLLASPGQNRSNDSDQIAAGESSCAGGNVPGSGALSPYCNDGSWNSAYSGSLAYQRSRLYLTTAYELHKRVNRTSDLPTYDARDVADETAIKGGIQYQFGVPKSSTTVSAIYESMVREVPQALQYQNERSRSGYWFALTQVLHPYDSVNFGWAHANAGNGDPGQHNSAGGLGADNAANMYTFAYKRAIDPHISWYTDYALTLNHPDAHYDLGAGGRGITTDCHDASPIAAFDPTTGTVSGNGPHCYAGGRLQGFSAGLDIRF